MPVRWTPDNDQLLLLKILETHDLAVDAKKISAAWPTDKGEVPTARAITERLVKIRSNVRTNGLGHFGITSAQSKAQSGLSSTSKKLTPLGTNPSSAPSLKQANMSTSRKHPLVTIKAEPSDQRVDDLDGETSGIPTSSQAHRMPFIAHSEATDPKQHPSKRRRTGTIIASGQSRLDDATYTNKMTKPHQPRDDVNTSYIV